MERAIDAFVGIDPGRSVRISGHGVTVGRSDATSRPGASVNKLFVAVAVALSSSAEELARTVAVRQLPQSVWPSVTLALDDDHRLSIAELTGLMLATSDNRISDHLVDRVGPERITQVARSIGCEDTVVTVGFADEHLGPSGRANTTTARDCDRVLAKIATDPVLGWLRPPMRSSLYNSRILGDLPDDVVVSHKTGTLAGVANDVGVIHALGGDLAVSFLTEGQPELRRTSADISRCARALLDATIERRLAG